jgi:hypothetical protein
VLQRVEAERNEARRIVGTPDAKDAALFLELVVVEWIGGQHVLGPAPKVSRQRHIGARAALVAPALNAA